MSDTEAGIQRGIYFLVLAIVFIGIFAFAGCASIPANPTEMTPDQLKEWVKDKNANIACGVINSPYGRGIAVYVVLDKAVVVNGMVTVDDACKVTITNAPAPKKE